MVSRPDEDKPCLVDTGQGLSVSYKGRLLYSRHNPGAQAERLVSQAEIKDNTLVLCCSPVLGYGLESLARKLPPSCLALVVEADERLFALYKESAIPKTFAVVAPGDIGSAARLFDRRGATASNGAQIPPPGSFRRCVRLDFSGASGIHPQIYGRLHHDIDAVIASFWKNRITLVKLGRLYHRNLFRNLWKIPFARELERKSIGRPILVAGAGPSADKTADELASFFSSERSRERIAVMAVDAALGPLLRRGIRPDYVVAQESQHAVQRAYHDAAGKEIHIIADLTSRPAVLENPARRPGCARALNCTGGELSFFSTEFADTAFLEKLRKSGLMPEEMPPLGSVGTTATELALRLRASGEIPVFVAGLDFAFPPGRTHAKGSMQHKAELERQDRLSPVGNPAAAFRETARKVPRKGSGFRSDYTLSRYAEIFAERYSGTPNLVSLGGDGLELGIPEAGTDSLLDAAVGFAEGTAGAAARKDEARGNGIAAKIRAAREFYGNEAAELAQLKDSLASGGAPQDELARMLVAKEYLYLHFPDGYAPSTKPQFLRRVRAEIDFFQKDIRVALDRLASAEESLRHGAAAGPTPPSS